MASEQLSKANALGERILSAAEAQDWQAVARLESEWGQFVRGCFDGPSAMDIVEARALQSINDRILSCLLGHRQQVAGERARLNRGSQASKAYQSLARR
jgi:hypothetical protein